MAFLGLDFTVDLLEMVNSTSLFRRKTLLHQTNKGVCRICIFLLQIFSTFISNLIRSYYEKIEVWRLDTNDATIFQTSEAIKSVSKTLPAGKYSLYVIPSISSWKLVSNF